MMEWFDPVFLSRIQFAFVVSFHIIFPAFTIGLASWLMVLEGMYLKTNHPVYKETYKHWAKIFAVTFGMGVVSGLVMSYQFGTNWAVFSDKAGNVIGPLLAGEVLTAFFLEASFLGIMLFGWNRVGPKMHFFATSMVAIGTVISAFWILSVNSWMQTPTGFRMDPDGLLYPTDWLQIIFNPSFFVRLPHMVIAAYLTTGFAVGGVAAWYMLRQQCLPHARIMFAMAMLMAIFVTPIQIYIGHEHGVNTLEYQPAKVAAMEGIWETEQGASLRLFGWPDQEAEETKYALEIPYGASLILKGDIHAEVKGLKEWDKDERPPVAWVFWSFRVMVGIGMLMMLTGLLALWQYARGKLFSTKWFHRWCFLMAPSGFLAVLAGWITTEVGRQPYVVYGVLRTADTASPITSHSVAISLVTFMVVYTIVFGAGIYYILHLIRRGPLVGDWHDAYGTHGLAHPATMADVFPEQHPGAQS